MSDYRLATDGVIRLRDNAFIPDGPDNKDWIEYKEWEKTNTVEPAMTKDQIKMVRWAEVQSRCKLSGCGDVSYDGKTYNSSLDLQIKLELVLQALGRGDLSEPIGWLDSSAQVQSLSALDLQALAKGMSKLSDESNDRAFTLKSLIDASDIPESIDIDSDWPILPYVVA